MFSHFPYISRSGVRIGVPFRIPVVDLYPKSDLILDFSDFDFTYVEVADKSVEDNDTILYSARAVNFDGIDDSASCDVTTASAVTDVKILAKSSTDTKVPTSLGSGTIVADGTWQEVAIETPAKNNGDKVWFNGADTYLDYGSSLLPATGDFDITFYWYIGESSAPVAFLYALEQGSSAATTSGLTLGLNGTISFYADSNFRIITGAAPYYNTLVKVQFKRTSGVFDLLLNDSSIGTWNGAGWSIEQVNTRWGNSAYLGSGRHITGQLYGDDVTGTQNGTFETTTQAFTSPSLTLGDLYEGELADLRLYNGTALLEEFYLNEHLDTSANGLNGLPMIGRKGNIGTYSGCNSVIQIGFDKVLAGLSEYNEKLWFDGVDDSIVVSGLTSSNTYFGDCTISATIKVNTATGNGAIWALGNACYRLAVTSGNFVLGGTGTGIAVPNKVINVEVDYVGSNAVAFRIDGATVWTGAAPSSSASTNFVFGGRDQSGIGYLKSCLITNFSITGVNGFTWDGTKASAITNGWAVNGTPNTIEELRKTPPQTLGMNHKNYMWFDGIDDRINTQTQLLPATADFTLTLEFIPTTNDKALFDQGTVGNAGRLYSSITANKARVFCDGFGAILDTANSVNYGKVNTLVFSVTSGTASLQLNGGTAVTTSASAIDQSSTFEIGAAYAVAPYSDGSFVSLTIGATTWDGTIKDAISKGWTVVGDPDSMLAPESTAGFDAFNKTLVQRESSTLNADSNGYTLVPDADSLDLTTEATWVIKGNFYGSVSSNETLLGKYDTNSKRSWWIYKANGVADDSLLMSISSDGVITTTHTLSGLTDENDYLVITYNTGEIKTYWKGVLIDTDASSLQYFYVSDIDVGLVSRIQNGGPNTVSSFPISDVKIYNRVLSSTEIAQLNNITINLIDGLVFGTPEFSEEDPEVEDISIEDNDAVIYSARAVSFDGIDDSISGDVTTSSAVTDIKLIARSSTNTTVPTSLGNGTIVADNTWQEVEVETPAKNYGNNIRFDGTDDYIETNITVDPTADWSFDFNIFISEYPADDVALLHDRGDGGLDQLVHVGLNENGTIFISAETDTGYQFLASSANLPRGEVLSCRLTHTISTKTIRLVITEVSVDISGVYTGTASIGNLNTVHIGRYANTTTNYYNNTFLSLSYNDGAVTWDGTEAGAISNGWAVYGTPDTVTNQYISPTLTLGDLYVGELANVRLYNNENLLEQFYLNDHSDTNANGLNTLKAIGTNGNVLTYNGCTAVIRIGMDSIFAKLENYGDKLWFDGVDDYVKTNYLPDHSQDFTISWTAYQRSDGQDQWQMIHLSNVAKNTDRFAVTSYDTGASLLFIRNDAGQTFGSSIINLSAKVDDFQSFVLTHDATAKEFTLDVVGGSSVTVAYTGTLNDILPYSLGTRDFGSKSPMYGYFTTVALPTVTWDGTKVNLPTGWTAEGSANSIEELRKTPPQLIGLEFNQSSDPVYAMQFSVKTDNVGTSGTDQVTIPWLDEGDFECVVNWGDGTTDHITTFDDPAWTHTFAGGAGTYTVTITGEIGRIHFNVGGDRLKIVGAVKEGSLGIGPTSLQNAWNGCNNITSFEHNLLRFSTATDYRYTWKNTGLSGSWTTELPLNATVYGGAFSTNALTSFDVDFPDGTSEIWQAFSSCNLTSWTRPLPESIYHMQSTFGSNQLTSWTTPLPSNLLYISSCWANNLLTSWTIAIPNSALQMNNAWFNNNITSWSVTLPTSLTTCTTAWKDNGLTTWTATIPSSITCTAYDEAWDNNALDEASVNFILTQIDAAGTSNGTIGIFGGTNAAPTGAGAAAVTNLESRGWAVNVNP